MTIGSPARPDAPAADIAPSDRAKWIDEVRQDALGAWESGRIFYVRNFAEGGASPWW